MNTTDPIADMLTRIRNANTSKHKTVDIPSSNMKKAIAEILFKEGYIKSYEEIADENQGMIRITIKYDEKDFSDMYRKLATKHQKEFQNQFYNKKKKSLYDVIGDDKIRPNQLFSLATTYPVISPASDMGKTIFETAKKKLLTKYGLRTLAEDEEGYIAEYSGDSDKRDMSYHQKIYYVDLRQPHYILPQLFILSSIYFLDYLFSLCRFFHYLYCIFIQQV